MKYLIDENIQIESALQKYEDDANRLAMANDDMYRQVRFYGKNVRDLEISNNRYWDAQIDYSRIVNNEEMRYDFFKHKEQAIVRDINKPNQSILLWRIKDKFYYRPSLFSSLIIGDEKKIAEEISSRYNNINVVFVSDLNDALSYKKMDIRIDTTYIAKNSIPVVDEEVFDITRMEEIFVNHQGSHSRNTLSYSSYLVNRFYDFDLKNEPESYAKHVIQNITNLKDLKFLTSRLGKNFKHLNSSNAIVLVGNKDVSEGILLNRVLKPIFGSQFCTTITDEMLRTMSMEDIVKHKLIYHISHIPESEQDREKLREILISILVDKFIQIENQFVPIHGQVFITMDKAHPFLKDFLSSSDIFFIDSMENIMTKLQEEDKISFHHKLQNSLTAFSKELSVLGSMPYDNSQQKHNQNEEFIKLLDDIDEEIVKLVKNNLLDPFDDNFENLIPVIERYKHCYITGQTGSGKSELLKTLILRDILRADGSVVLLEPHGDLSEQVAKMVHDKTRLVYLNPFLGENQAPTINLFHLEDKSEANIARVTQIILNVLKGINSDESFSGAMEDHLEMCIRVLLRRGNGSFQELYRFLNDNRNDDLIEFGINSPNPLESEFFDDDFKNPKVSVTKDALRRRLKKLLNDHVFSNMMNGKNVIDLEKVMNTKGMVIIFNIPKGKMTNTYKYYIRFIVEYIQILALKRADISEEERTHTHLYIDEAHNFISSTATISEILTESRKYKLFVTFAHQAITQIRDSNLRDIMTTMTNVKIIGKNSNKTLEAMNKTLNTKLEDVETLKAGEFYLSAGSNDIIKINNTDKLLDGKEEISDAQWQEHKQYQLTNYYRSTKVFNFDEAVDKFVGKLLSEVIDLKYFEQLQKYPEKYAEFLYNLVDDENGRFVAQPEMSFYFNIISSEAHVSDNKLFLSELRNRYEVFKQNPKDHKKYNDKFRYKLL
ncbi:MAG: type IV secretion system DNA-binding domain-containing protein [Sulfurimonas sp.]|uniref:type IV secretory system conjugative DNA transfer family protein n=1 Tax=Sulfurimonas sp. TaxID=2022749 RepID=UPI00263213F2|nr:type IV secretion system DNA-binding domain-containing protein [Sulfurimonas sp.]MDD5399577.1 type IV secretion system DNA-binding domain-containing protein [Sulfurimonas sp.]